MSKELVKSKIKEINELHKEVFGAVKMTLDKAIKIGKLLTECKKEIPFGEWMQWMRINLEFSDQTARNYMKVYEIRDDKFKSLLNLNQVYQSLIEHKPEKKQPVTYLAGSPEEKEFEQKFIDRRDSGESREPTRRVGAVEAEIIPEDEVEEYGETFSVKDEGINFDDEWWEKTIIKLRDKAIVKAGSIVTYEDPLKKHLGSHDEPHQLINTKPWEHFTRVKITVTLIKEGR